jgi:hypothetical protein
VGSGSGSHCPTYSSRRRASIRSRADISSVTVGGVSDIASAYSITSRSSGVKTSDSRHRGTRRIDLRDDARWDLRERTDIEDRQNGDPAVLKIVKLSCVKSVPTQRAGGSQGG